MFASISLAKNKDIARARRRGFALAGGTLLANSRQTEHECTKTTPRDVLPIITVQYQAVECVCQDRV